MSSHSPPRPVPARGGTVTTASAIDAGNVAARCLLEADGDPTISCADLADLLDAAEWQTRAPISITNDNGRG